MHTGDDMNIWQNIIELRAHCVMLMTELKKYNPVKLEIGKKYLCKNGRKVLITESYNEDWGDKKLAFIGYLYTDIEAPIDNISSPQYYIDGKEMMYGCESYDLIKEITGEDNV